MTQSVRTYNEHMPRRPIRKKQVLTSEEKARMALGEMASSTARNLLGNDNQKFVSSDQFAQAIFAAPTLEACVDTNPHLENLVSFLGSISSAKLGDEIELLGSKHDTPEPLKARIWTFAEDGFEPVRFKLKQGETMKISPNYYGSLVLSMVTSSAVGEGASAYEHAEISQVDFMNFYAHIDPTSGVLVTRPSYTKYNQAEFGGQIFKQES